MDYINNTQMEQKNSTNVNSVFTHPALPVLYSIICACAFILNGLAAWIFFRVPSSSALVIYLKNMVVADILMLFTYPWRVVGIYLGFGGLQLKLIVCRYTTVLFYLCMYTGITFMSLISLERYFKIVHSNSAVSSRLQRVSVAKALALLAWSVMIFFMLPNTILTNQSELKDSCMKMKSELGLRWHEISVHFSNGTFWMAFMLMVFCYTSISYHVYRSCKRVQQDSSEARRRSNRSIFSLLAVFVFCFVPYHVCRIPYTLSQRSNAGFSEHSRFILFQLKEATLFLSALNVCLDPVIYFFMCRTFRESLLQKMSSINQKNRRPSIGTGLSISNL